MQRRINRSFLVGLLLAAGVLAGCSREPASADRMEERDPLFRRAIARKNVEDIEGAIEAFNRALERKPTMARAHLETGLLYDMKQQDYVRAIYHYQRYLELRPDAEKRELIEGLIRQARLSFAAALPHQPAGAVEEIAILKREIAVLKNQLDVTAPTAATAAKAGVPASAASKPAASASQPPVPKPEPAQPAMQPYVVQSGDTLSSIAGKVYKDPGKWKVIYDANRNVMSRPEAVKVGQTLLIPR